MKRTSSEPPFCDSSSSFSPLRVATGALFSKWRRKKNPTFLFLVLETDACTSEFCLCDFSCSVFFQVLALFCMPVRTLSLLQGRKKTKGSKNDLRKRSENELAFTWKPLIDRWVVLWPRFGNPGASGSGFLKLACRKLSELLKSRSGYCCMGGKESQRDDSTWKQTRQVCWMKGQVSNASKWCKGGLVLHLRWAGGNINKNFKKNRSCASSLHGELFGRASDRVCLTRLDVCIVDQSELIWIHLRSSDKYWSDGVARAVLSQLRRSLPGSAEMDWGE